jgi:hypothetical protein
MAADRTWFSPDGKELYLKKSGTLERWDVESKSFRQQWQLVDDSRSFDIVGVAPEANLVARRMMSKRTLEFIDAGEGKVVSSITGFKRLEVSGLSQDGKRLVVPTLDKKVFVVDFPNGIPAGAMTLSQLEQKAETDSKR